MHIPMETTDNEKYRSFFSLIESSFNEDSRAAICRAFERAHTALEGMTRYDGSPLFDHSVRTAEIVISEIGLGRNSTISTLLHDVARLGLIDEEEIIRDYGTIPVSILEGMNLISKVRTKVSAAESLEKLYVVDVRRIQRPSQPFFPLFRFLRKVVKLRKSGTPMPRIPQGNAERCTHCGRCVEACPAQAIVKGDECNTIAERCIKCCACVKQCPQGARTFDTPFAPLLSDCFKRQKQDRIIL